MLDLRFVRENIDFLKEKLTLRGEDLDLSPQLRIYVPDLEKMKTSQAPVADKLSP